MSDQSNVGELAAELSGTDLECARARLRQERDGAYLERNRLVALLASIFPSARCRTAIEGWDPAWHNCVYIVLPTGQCSWHYHDREAELFARVPFARVTWDGHTTEMKYERVAEAARIDWSAAPMDEWLPHRRPA